MLNCFFVILINIELNKTYLFVFDGVSNYLEGVGYDFLLFGIFHYHNESVNRFALLVLD